MVIAVPFLAGFTRDWLVVSGQLDPASPAYLAVRRVIDPVLTRWLPPVWRSLCFALTAHLLLATLTPPADPLVFFVWFPLSWPALAAGLLIGLAVITRLLVTLGLAGRLGRPGHSHRRYGQYHGDRPAL